MNPAALTIAATRAQTRLADYVELTKPRVVAMVLLTALAGFYLGSGSAFDSDRAAWLVVGVALAAAGTLALNQYIERDLDALMHRTRARPLPAGRLVPRQALACGVVLTVAGLGVLCAGVNLLSAAVVSAITIVYLFAYTPLKRISWICNLVGAIPGALPPVAGWAAARGTLGAEPLVLFAILFLWQLPHSLAIARLYRNDYARAGIRLLPVEDPRGNPTAALVVGTCAALIVAGALPTLMGFDGLTYLIVAAMSGFAFLCFAIRMTNPSKVAAARHLVLASVVYLPLVLLAMALDRL